MLKRISLTLLAICTIARAETINFTPQFEITREDGVPMQRVYFTSENLKIFYDPVRNCEVRGSTSEVRLVPKTLLEAEARIENAPPGMPSAFDENGLKVYRAVAENLLPKGVEAVTPLEEKLDPIPINDWRGFEKAFTYTLGGRQFTCGILFVKLDTVREIRLVVTSREKDFGNFYQAARASLNSWLETKL